MKVKRNVLLSLSFLAGGLVASCGEDPNASADDVTMISRALDSEKFTPWTAIPDTAGGEVGSAIASRVAGQRDLFLLAANGYVSWKHFAPGGWSSATLLESVPVASGSRPAASKWSSLSGEIWTSNHLAVAIRRTNNYISVKVLNPNESGSGGWTAFQQIPFGGPFVDSPAIAYHRQGTGAAYLYVIARKSDRRYYWTRNRVDHGYNHANWSTWSAIPNGEFLTGPAAVSSTAGLWVVGVGLDHRLYEATYGGSWDGWYQLPNQAIEGLGTVYFRTDGGSPAVAAWPNGRFHVFAFGDTDHSGIFQSTWVDDGWGWAPFERLWNGASEGGCPSLVQPAAHSWDTNHLEVVGTGAAGTCIDHREYITGYDPDA